MPTVGTIKEIWRYPVKSMRGELIQNTRVGTKGVLGDRGWAIRDEEAGEVRGARNFPSLLNCFSRYEKSPTSEPYPPAIISFPDGSQALSNSEGLNLQLSKYLGKKVSIWPILPSDQSDHYKRLPIDEAELRRLFAREEGEPIPDLSQFPEYLMEYVSPEGTYFDAHSVHVLTTATLKHMESLNPDSNWSVQRFRPNLVIDTGDEPELIENTWIGKILSINGVELKCVGPVPRCAMTAHPQGDDIDKDPKILRTIVKDTDQNLGVYFEVLSTGEIHTGNSAEISG